MVRGFHNLSRPQPAPVIRRTNMQSLQQELSACCREFHVQKQEKGLVVSSIFRFPPSFPGFAGHFPTRPVLPAIIQLAAIRHLAELALASPLLPTGYGRTKFRGIVPPDEEISCALLLEEAQDQWAGRFSIRRMDNDLVADGSCTFRQLH
jgi:3-hydroxyacyl-[acyl-carrier-protein] dehydratase